MMVERVKGISIQGRCYENSTALALFEDKRSGKNSTECRLSIVFGKNGSGKSTIADAFSQIARNVHPDTVDGPHNSSDLNAHLFDKDKAPVTAKDGEIFVFNEKYIDENVKVSTDGLGTIVLLGEKVGLQAQIDQCRKDQEKAENRLKAADEKRKPFHNPKNPLSPDYHMNNVKKTLSQGWQGRETGFGQKRPNITAKVIDTICGMTPAGTIEDLLEEFGNKMDEFRMFLDAENLTFEDLPSRIVLGGREEEALRALLAKKLTEPVLTERETRIMNVIRDKLSFGVADTKKYFENPSVDFCPYCFRPISHQEKEDIIHGIDIVLNKDVEEHAQELSSFAKVLRDAESTSKSIIDMLKKSDHRRFIALGILDLVQDIQAAAEQYLDAVRLCLDHIQYKCQHPYTPVVMNISPAERGRTLNTLLNKYADKREVYSQNQRKKDEKIKEMIKELSQLNGQISALETAQSYADYRTQADAKNKCEKEYAARLKEYEEVSGRLNQLRREAEDTVIATEKINSLLDYVFFHKGRLSIEFVNNTYRLKANGKDVRPRDVSSGERNIIALCYFFTQLLSGQKESEFYKRKMLVVIDDPVSSFDAENRVGIITLLRYQLRQIITGCPDSKAVVLSHNLTTVLDLGKAEQEIRAAVKGDPRLKTDYNFWELKNRRLQRFPEKKRDEYSELLERIYQFASGIADDDLTIGNVMRRTLEAFSTFSYQKGIDKVSTDPNILKELGSHSQYFENLMYRLVLHGESHFEERVHALDSEMNFFAFISTEEKRETAKIILCLMHLLNPLHIEMYFGEGGGSKIQTIEEWENLIPDNDTLTGKKREEKRHLRRGGRVVPLYELPLSAGPGNIIFDDTLPHKEYATGNKDCDFALRVSGDSMEPEIPDGSIVLIRKTEEIPGGKIGAFRLNSEALCKRFYRDDEGKAFLISANTAYSPILIKENDDFQVFGQIIEVVSI